MKKFDRKDWTAFMDRINDMNIQLLENSYDRKSGKIVNIRHDIDDDIQASFDMARLEQAEYNVKSTFFILDTAPYWENIESEYWYKKIASMGHALGWHNNAISNHLRTGKPIIDCILEPLHRLRDVADVIGTASHGDPLCHEHRYLNYYLFKESRQHPDFPNVQIGHGFKMDDFGLKYEAYHTGHTHYISDSGGNWQQDNEAVLKDFEKKGGKLQILLHPQWWQL